MPIEIKEMYIKINVDEGANSGNTREGSSKSNDNKDAIIAACVETIMGILEKQKER